MSRTRWAKAREFLSLSNGFRRVLTGRDSLDQRLVEPCGGLVGGVGGDDKTDLRTASLQPSLDAKVKEVLLVVVMRTYVWAPWARLSRRQGAQEDAAQAPPRECDVEPLLCQRDSRESAEKKPSQLRRR